MNKIAPIQIFKTEQFQFYFTVQRSATYCGGVRRRATYCDGVRRSAAKSVGRRRPERVELMIVSVSCEVVDENLLPVFLRVSVNDRHVHV